jgi:tRNA dimethylallyltransferase
MFRRGWVAETEALLKCGLAQNQTAMQALGYRQIVEHLRGERSLPETIALVKLRTRQFAKRQMTWFRRQLRLTWIALEPHASAEAAVQFLVTSSTHWASI